MSLVAFAGVLLAAAPDPGSAATPAPLAAAPAAASSAAGSGVVRYGADFFVSMRPNTAFDMIQRLPGFAFDAGANVRGFAGAAGNVLIDGDRPTTKEDNLENILKRVAASQVDHIDLIRGAAPGIDMQGRTVLANVVLKGGAGMHGVVAIASNVYADGRLGPAARLEFSRQKDGRTLEFSLLPAMYVDDGAGNGPRVRTDPAGAVLVRSNLRADAGGKNVTATSAYTTPLWGGKFKVNVLGVYDRYHDNENDHLVTPVGLEALHDLQEQGRGELGVHFEKALSPRLNLETLAIQQVKKKTYTSHFDTAAESDFFTETDTSGESIARATLRYRKSEHFSTELAAEGAYNIQKSDSRFAVDAANVPLPAADVTVKEKRGELAASATWRPDRRYTLEGGVRLEASNISSSGGASLSKTLVFPKPRLVFTWSPNEKNQVRLRVEREVGQLNFGDFVASSSFGAGAVRAGNPDLIPQNAWVGEATYEKHIADAVFVLTLRRQQISDVVDRIPIFAPSGVFDAPGNIGSARETDVEGNFTLPMDRFGLKHGQLKAQGTWRHSSVADPTTGAWRRISGQHPFDYEIHYTQDLPRWKSTWGIDVFNRWTETYYRFSEIDAYKLKTWVDVFLEYKPRANFSLRLEADNIGGRGFQRVLNVYSGPRNTNPLLYVDNRRQDFKPLFYFRVRQTFG